MTTKPLRVVLRADAGVRQGSGHVMRSLTLAEPLIARGHEVLLVGSLLDEPWLLAAVEASGVRVVPSEPDDLDAGALLAMEPDRVVVDSYRIDSAAVSELAARVPLLAVIDGDDRGIEAAWYLDHNLGADDRSWPPAVAGRLLAGSRYALVRSAVTAMRRDDPWRIAGTPPRVISVMGGTDPAASSVRVAASLAALGRPLDLTVIAAAADHAAVTAAAPAGTTVLTFTVDLPRMLAASDVVVSAAGTSAWDVCTLGTPAVLVGLVGNQSDSLAAAVERGLVLGIDAAETGPDAIAGVGERVAALLDDEPLRRRLSTASRAVFDGRGPERVADALEAAPRTIS